MTKFESGVKVIPASQSAVYGKLSDLSNLEKIKDRLPEDKVSNANPRNASSSALLPRRCPSTCGYRLCLRARPSAR